MESAHRRLKVPVLGWVLGGLVLVAMVLLLLPSNKQKRFNEAKARLERAKAAAAPIEPAFRENQFRVFKVPHSTKRSDAKIVIWNPKSGNPYSDYTFDLPDLKSLSSQTAFQDAEYEVPTSGVIFAPDPKSTGYTDYAVLCLLWEKQRHKWEWLELLRRELAASSTQPSAIARIKKNIEEADPTAVSEARKQIATNVELVKGLDEADEMYVIDGTLFIAHSHASYTMRNNYNLVHPKSAQPPN